MIALLGLVGRSVATSRARGPILDQEWAELIASAQYRCGNPAADRTVQRALLLGLRRKADRRHDPALTLLRGVLIEVITSWHLSTITQGEADYGLAPESDAQIAARLFSCLRHKLSASMHGERERHRLTVQHLLARGHTLPEKTAVELWEERWIGTSAARCTQGGAVRENILTGSELPVWTGWPASTPPILDPPTGAALPPDTLSVHLDAVTARSVHAPPALTRTGWAVTVNSQQDSISSMDQAGSVPDSTESLLLASMEAATAALTWLSSQCPVPVCGPVRYAPPAIVICSHPAGTLLMTGLWVPSEEETSPYIARAARTLHRLWRRTACYRTLWARIAPPHRTHRWGSERARALATWAIRGEAPSYPGPGDECSVCYETFSDILPTANDLSASAHMYACPAIFPGHVVCRGCETLASAHLAVGAKCPLCRANRIQRLLG